MRNRNHAILNIEIYFCIIKNNKEKPCANIEQKKQNNVIVKA